MSEVFEDGLVGVHIQAEHAPIGVQLWPTRTPGQAHHFTLRSVAVVRNEVREWVVWTYEDNNIRTFELGEKVVARVSPQVATAIEPTQTAVRLTIEEQEVVRDALRMFLSGRAPADLAARADLVRSALDRMVMQI